MCRWVLGRRLCRLRLGGRCRCVLDTCESECGAGRGGEGRRGKGKGRGSAHSAVCPLRFFEDVEAGVDDELVHVLGCVGEAEAGYAVAAAFGGTEGDVEYRGVGW